MVFGAAGGIGAALVQRLSGQQGAKVVQVRNVHQPDAVYVHAREARCTAGCCSMSDCGVTLHAPGACQGCTQVSMANACRWMMHGQATCRARSIRLTHPTSIRHVTHYLWLLCTCLWAVGCIASIVRCIQAGHGPGTGGEGAQASAGPV